MRCFLFLLLTPLLAFADSKEFASLEGEPSSYIEDCVSAITGDLIIDQHDIVVQGAEPLAIRRRFLSREMASPLYQWTPFPHCFAFFEGKRNEFTVPEPNMIHVTYAAKNKERYTPIKTLFESGIIAQDHLRQRPVNPADNELTRDSEGFFITLPNGTKRHYKAMAKPSPYVKTVPRASDKKDNHYYLVKESLPSGNVLHYSYTSADETRYLPLKSNAQEPQRQRVCTC